MMYKEVMAAFYEHRDREKAEKMAAYMKGNFPFLGITKKDRLSLQSAFISQAKNSGTIDWELVFHLWALPEREFQYLALDYLLVLRTLLQEEDIGKLKTLITTKAWWDTVDGLAGNMTGTLCAKFPGIVENQMLQWAESGNIWLVRAAIIFQLKYKEKTDTEILGRVIEKNSNTKEFFINKAIGWALREYSKTNRAWVRTFIENHSLPARAVREGSKYI
ncbi:MAG TPA: DNA alkylation repair protein [Firmicutes bacterium]|nr:DNA alkylation repair protein [Bacillota bacterium]